MQTRPIGQDGGPHLDHVSPCGLSGACPIVAPQCGAPVLLEKVCVCVGGGFWFPEPEGKGFTPCIQRFTHPESGASDIFNHFTFTLLKVPSAPPLTLHSLLERF